MAQQVQAPDTSGGNVGEMRRVSGLRAPMANGVKRNAEGPHQPAKGLLARNATRD